MHFRSEVRRQAVEGQEHLKQPPVLSDYRSPSDRLKFRVLNIVDHPDAVKANAFLEKEAGQIGQE